MAPGKEKPVVTPDAAAVRAQVEAEMAQKREALGNTIAPSDAPRQNPSDSAQQRERALAAQRTALVDLERDVDGAIADDRADATTSTLPGSPAARTSGIKAIPAVSAVISIGAMRSLPARSIICGVNDSPS